MQKQKVAVVLLNLGGPTAPAEVEPFLFSMFSDKHIMDYPKPVRLLLAKVISKLRARKSQKIYEHLAGKSPILQETEQQALSLERRLCGDATREYKVFVSMRHSKPHSQNVLDVIYSWSPEIVVLLPLYPQYASVTTQSSIENWYSSMHRSGYMLFTDIIWHFFNHPKYIESQCKLILDKYKLAQKTGRAPRVLFSAHGLPCSFIENGDPYNQHILHAAELIVKKMGLPALDYSVCYQSRVGPVKWLGPSTESELLRAKRDEVPVVVVPLSFVAENSETLVELDIEYKVLVEENMFYRVPTPGTEESFIECLADLVFKKVM
ncbi:ferrochelatase [Anaplasma platys]|uniref:Ferrochelatase n=1 Tax=Anaplasma platys TaxID=949 RepID=A0A858PXQ2_9RICK|nr:ferrochelatase [Anaplasma platys]QJC27338.1 ferrochelatase [Anaplasma platys]